LQQKQYCLFNKQLSKEEWESKVGSFIYTRSQIEEAKRNSAEIEKAVPKRAVRTFQCEDSVGDHLLESRDAYWCFDSKNLEHCAYCYEVLNGAKYCHDYSMWGINCELLYECSGCGYDAYHCLFSNHCWNNVSYLLYCESCFPSVHHCFGSFGLRRKQHCILNKSYTKAEYEKLIPRIAAHMRETGEWGEFFPISLSMYAYNEALSGEFFPLDKETVLGKGWSWREPAESSVQGGGTVKIPERIEEVENSICESLLSCEKTGKAYKVVRQELDLLRKLGLPVPRIGPVQRHAERIAQRNHCFLLSRECSKCQCSIQSSSDPEGAELVYCEDCYQAAVY
jgi:hypothetical protein